MFRLRKIFVALIIVITIFEIGPLMGCDSSISIRAFAEGITSEQVTKQSDASSDQATEGFTYVYDDKNRLVYIKSIADSSIIYQRIYDESNNLIQIIYSK